MHAQGFVHRGDARFIVACLHDVCWYNYFKRSPYLICPCYRPQTRKHFSAEGEKIILLRSGRFRCVILRCTQSQGISAPIAGITAEHNSTAAQAGTNTFRAPETYQMSTGLVTCTADVFSFAMIMYILRLGLRLWCTPKNEAGEMKQPDEGTFKARGLIAHVPCNRPPVWEDELELQANWTTSAVVVRQIGFKVWDTTNNLWKRETAPLVFQPQYPSAYDKKYVELM